MGYLQFDLYLTPRFDPRSPKTVLKRFRIQIPIQPSTFSCEKNFKCKFLALTDKIKNDYGWLTPIWPPGPKNTLCVHFFQKAVRTIGFSTQICLKSIILLKEEHHLKTFRLSCFFVIFRFWPIFGQNTPSSLIAQKVLFTTISEKALWFFVSPRHHTNIIHWDQLWVKHCILGCRQVQD